MIITVWNWRFGVRLSLACSLLQVTFGLVGFLRRSGVQGQVTVGEVSKETVELLLPADCRLVQVCTQVWDVKNGEFDESENCSLTNSSIMADKGHAYLADLEPCTTYRIAVQALNDTVSTWLGQVDVFTFDMNHKAYTIVRDVLVDPTNATTVDVTWSPLTAGTLGLRVPIEQCVRGYVVRAFLKELRYLEPKKAVVIAVEGTESSHATVPGLLPCTEYLIQVKASLQTQGWSADIDWPILQSQAVPAKMPGGDQKYEKEESSDVFKDFRSLKSRFRPSRQKVDRGD
ncbi:uncharacterized protein LOC117643332 [Thrips palmi]|uniref:Uncharacterized protein LOC117643332 n=1 Tax=Thrips palmi TaxID=161013 RepID=A0A6P8YEB8_THRPL|nr:uncharacterized protein LOC117643332 [Thrips palmi]